MPAAVVPIYTPPGVVQAGFGAHLDALNIPAIAVTTGQGAEVAASGRTLILFQSDINSLIIVQGEPEGRFGREEDEISWSGTPTTNPGFSFVGPLPHAGFTQSDAKIAIGNTGSTIGMLALALPSGSFGDHSASTPDYSGASGVGSANRARAPGSRVTLNSAPRTAEFLSGATFRIRPFAREHYLIINQDAVLELTVKGCPSMDSGREDDHIFDVAGGTTLLDSFWLIGPIPHDPAFVKEWEGGEGHCIEVTKSSGTWDGGLLVLGVD